ncbi:MAG: hypothetical protein K8R57_10210 [Verrucomicrobia bacterium]|nr:hypothetical protein [Verrucomicrobiota bacterium]
MKKLHPQLGSLHQRAMGVVQKTFSWLMARLPEKWRVESPGALILLAREQLGARPSFALIVVLPSALALVYYGLIASDVYVTESTFVIHSQSQQVAPSGIGAMLQKTGLGSIGQSSDNVSAVSEYITSRDALKELDESMNLMRLWSSWRIDPIQRFAPLGFGRKFEYFYPYYKKHVAVNADEKSSLCTLSVKGFTAKQSLEINMLLLDAAEKLVNKLNERARNNTIGYALKEVEGAQRHVKEASGKMTEEAAKVASQDLSLSAKDSQYQLLLLDREFAKSQLASTMASLQMARDQAQRQDLYLEVVSQPHLPDVAIEPNRIKSIISVLAVGLLLWGVWSLFIAGVKEHQH